ncbi:MAG: nicotinate-nucleotide adenylyltransferase [candidate division Zixibacteria bacterium]|nr:nicotinate-nucleotide adenylyltransferase [candidate division Zixibacteria bacterium]
MPAPEPGERWGILGGVFDPVHFGHLTLARDVLGISNLNGVLLVPTCQPPHRSQQPAADFEDRIAMLRLALVGRRGLEISRIEDATPRPSYTLQTVKALKQAHPAVEFMFIIGADNLSQLQTWHKWTDILREVRLVVGCRPGASIGDLSAFPSGRIDLVETSEVDLSSTLVRERVKCGATREELVTMVPAQVADFILQRKLYQ